MPRPLVRSGVARLAVEELHQDGFAAQDGADWAQRIVSDAWTREQIGSPLA